MYGDLRTRTTDSMVLCFAGRMEGMRDEATRLYDRNEAMNIKGTVGSLIRRENACCSLPLSLYRCS